MQRETEARPAWVMEREKRDGEIGTKRRKRKRDEERGVRVLERRCRGVRVGVLWLNQDAAACKIEQENKGETWLQEG